MEYAGAYFQAVIPVQLQFAENFQLTEPARRHAIEKSQALVELTRALQADALIPSIGTAEELDERVSGIANSVIGLVNHEMVAYIAEKAMEVFAMQD